MTKKNPVSTTDIVDQIIDLAIANNASDIHFEPFEDKLRVRFRQDGVLYIVQDLPKSYISDITRRVKIMGDADIAEARRHQGGRLVYNHKSGEIDIRFSTYVTIHGEKIVLRLMGLRGRKILNIKDIGMPPRSFIRFREYGLKRPSGVIVFTGPTGSGKTNSVYSCIDYLNTPEVSILTAEEPVESLIDGICQCSINPKINLTFEETLRHVVRQDPDIVVIGEIRDAFSAEIAVEASLTGHKILTTFHTEDSVGTIIRLLSINLEPFLVASTLSCIVAQRLVRKICENCKTTYKADAKELMRLGLHPENAGDLKLFKGAGCEKCRNTGYNCRMGIFEVLVINDLVRDAILKQKSAHEIRHICLQSADLITLYEHGIIATIQGLTTLDEIRRQLPKMHAPRPIDVIKKQLGYV